MPTYSMGNGTFLTDVGSHLAPALYFVLMVAVIVGLDVLVFRGRFWERLIVNVGIVLVFIGFYLRFRQ